MPRKPLLYVPGGIYHTVLRGNNRAALFFDPADRISTRTRLALPWLPIRRIADGPAIARTSVERRFHG